MDSLICALITYLLKTTFLSLVFPILHSYPFSKINKKEKSFLVKKFLFSQKGNTHKQKLFYSKDICFENKKNISTISTCLLNTQNDLFLRGHRRNSKTYSLPFKEIHWNHWKDVLIYDLDILIYSLSKQFFGILIKEYFHC